MKPDRHYILSKFLFSILLATLIVIPQNSHATDFSIHHNPQSYILNKLQSHDIVFLGTRHKQPPILEFISKIITELHNSGVTHIGLEIASDQQGKIDRYMNTGAGLDEIQIHPQIDCSEYRNLFNVIRGLDPDKRPIPVALDLPKSKYKGKISRDEWMARSVAGVFESNPNAKILVVVGNNHILKKLNWQDKVINKHKSIREYLSEKRGGLRMVSIGQVIGKSVYEDDFRREFGQIEGAVAIDLDERFAGRKLAITQSMAIKPAGVWELLDGVIVYD
jgi:uncharacterized iron-regulated protein